MNKEGQGVKMPIQQGRTGDTDGLGWVRCALVVVDMVESVRLMRRNQSDVILRWMQYLDEVRQSVLPAHGGRLIKSLGDGLLLRFDDAVAARRGASCLLDRLPQLNAGRSVEDAIQLRIGLHVGDIIERDIDVFGADVNLTARLASLAGPDQIVMSAEARDALWFGEEADFDDLGACYVKHLDAPVRAFRLRNLPEIGQALRSPSEPLGASVVVMPLRPRIVGAGRHAVGDVIVDEVVASLSRTSYLTVISRLSTQADALRTMTLPALGETLGAAYVVSGSFDAEGDQVSVQMEMARAHSGALLWARSWKCRLPALLAGDDNVVPEVVSSICTAILQTEVSLSRSAPLPSLDSHSLLMSGIGLIHRSATADFARARELLDDLAYRHARRPQPNAWLGKWHVLSSVQGLVEDPDRTATEALSSASRALEADPDSALALAVKGHVHGFLARELDRADALLQRATEVNPNEPLAWIYLAALRAWQGRASEGLPLARRALQLSPRDPLHYYFDTLLAFVAMTADEHALALDYAERSLRSHRLHLSTHRTLAISAWSLGQHDRARAIVQEMLRIDPGFTTQRYRARYPGGDSEQAQRNAEVLRACGAPH